MQINSYKLINQLLPTFMRGDRITEFIRVMLLQLEKSYNAFNANLPDWMYKANANASVISLHAWASANTIELGSLDRRDVAIFAFMIAAKASTLSPASAAMPAAYAISIGGYHLRASHPVVPDSD